MTSAMPQFLSKLSTMKLFDSRETASPEELQRVQDYLAKQNGRNRMETQEGSRSMPNSLLDPHLTNTTPWLSKGESHFPSASHPCTRWFSFPWLPCEPSYNGWHPQVVHEGRGVALLTCP